MSRAGHAPTLCTATLQLVKICESVDQAESAQLTEADCLQQHTQTWLKSSKHLNFLIITHAHWTSSCASDYYKEKARCSKVCAGAQQATDSRQQSAPAD